ncbi:MAG: hypothetical protein II680_10860 [Clostridia bacterium]|nr:hypothetical protein [Clostridia bacterium]
MKCRAVETLQNERTEQVTKMYGTKALEAMQSEAALLLLDNFPWFRRAGLKTYFDGQAGNCSRELTDNAADRIFIKDRRGRHEADEIMRFEEVVNDAEYMLARKMDFGGIEPEPVWERAEARVPDKLFLGTDRIHADARIAGYAYLGRRAVRVWIASGTLALLDMRYPSGRRRFPIVKVERDFTLPLADFMAGWLERFIGGQDRDRTAEQHGRLRRLRDEYDVDLTPVSEQEREEDETGRIGTVSKPFRADPPKPIREAPEAFRKIMEDVRAGRGVGLFPGK